MSKPIKLKIALKDLPHKCNRTLLVPDTINMRQLHFIIQESFGWWNCHLFEFTDAKYKPTIRVGMPDEVEMEWEGPEKIEAHQIALIPSFLQAVSSKGFWYNYDFGDDWWHRISLLKVTGKDEDRFKNAPLCTKAEGKRPPEDVGGVWGYTEFLEILKDKKHPEHKETRTWCGLEKGETYDETSVDLEEINFQLKEFYESPQWDSQEYTLI